MKKEHPRWGPDMSNYAETFEGRIRLAYDNYVGKVEITSEAYEGLPPLLVLESMLAVSENMHKEGFQLGENSIPVIMRSIRRYTELQEHGIFTHYYGFLCIRHLMRMVCIGTLLENYALERFLGGLSPGEDSLQITHKLADRSIEIMNNALATTDFMKIARVLGIGKGPTIDAFPSLGGLSYEDAAFLVQTLWKDRRAILTVGRRGLLPGLGVLLFALSEMTTFNVKYIPNFTNWPEIQELMARYYLVASGSERAILRQLTRFIDQTMLQRGQETHFPRYQEDAREVIQAFADMMYSPLTPNLANILPFDTGYVLFRFIGSLCTARVEDMIPMAIRAGLERIWLECDKERDGFLAANRRGFTRQYMNWIFGRLLTIWERITTQAAQAAFGETLIAESNIVGLAGRVLLMFAMDDRKPDMWDEMLASLDDLLDLVAIVTFAGSTSHVSFHAVVEWKKVWTQLHLIQSRLVPTKVPSSYVDHAISAWKPLGPAAEESEMCDNPRCPVMMIDAKPKEAHFACSRCCQAKYCSSRCQTSHLSHCIQPELAKVDLLMNKMASRKYFLKYDVPVDALKQRPDYDDLRRRVTRG